MLLEYKLISLSIFVFVRYWLLLAPRAALGRVLRQHLHQQRFCIKKITVPYLCLLCMKFYSNVLSVNEGAAWPEEGPATSNGCNGGESRAEDAGWWRRPRPMMFGSFEPAAGPCLVSGGGGGRDRSVGGCGGEASTTCTSSSPSTGGGVGDGLGMGDSGGDSGGMEGTSGRTRTLGSTSSSIIRISFVNNFPSRIVALLAQNYGNTSRYYTDHTRIPPPVSSPLSLKNHGWWILPLSRRAANKTKTRKLLSSPRFLSARP